MWYYYTYVYIYRSNEIWECYFFNERFQWFIQQNSISQQLLGLLPGIKRDDLSESKIRLSSGERSCQPTIEVHVVLPNMGWVTKEIWGLIVHVQSSLSMNITIRWTPEMDKSNAGVSSRDSKGMYPLVIQHSSGKSPYFYANIAEYSQIKSSITD